MSRIGPTFCISGILSQLMCLSFAMLFDSRSCVDQELGARFGVGESTKRKV